MSKIASITTSETVIQTKTWKTKITEVVRYGIYEHGAVLSCKDQPFSDPISYYEDAVKVYEWLERNIPSGTVAELKRLLGVRG